MSMGPFLLLFLVGAFVTRAWGEASSVLAPNSLNDPTSLTVSNLLPTLSNQRRVLAETITKPSRVEEQGEDEEESDDEEGSEEGDVEAEGDDEPPADSEGESTEPLTTTPPKKKGKKGATTTTAPSKKKGKKATTTTTPEPEEEEDEDETPAPPPPPPKKKGKKGKQATTTTPEPEEGDEEDEAPPPRGKKPKKNAGGNPPPSDDDEDSEGDADQPPPPPAPGGKKGKKKASTPLPTKSPAPDESSTSSPKWAPELKAGKFVDFHDIIEYFVQNNHDRTFSGMLVFQIIKFRNGDAAIEKRFIDRLIKCLKPALPELRVLATLRRRMRQGLSGKDRDQARGLAARTVTTAIKHFYYAADEEGIPVRLIVGVINAMHTFEQASYTNPLEERPGGPGSSRDGMDSDTGKGNDGFNRPSSRLRDSYLSFEEELERLLDEIESDIMDDYEASLRGQYLPGGDTLDDASAQRKILDAIGAMAQNDDAESAETIE